MKALGALFIYLMLHLLCVKVDNDGNIRLVWGCRDEKSDCWYCRFVCSVSSTSVNQHQCINFEFSCD